MVCPSRLVEGNGMSVAVEGTAIVSTGGHATVFTDCNVPHKDSIDILRVDCIINSHSELVPVVSTVDDEAILEVVFRILRGGITVDESQGSTGSGTSPCVAILITGANVFGLEEAVVDDNLTARIYRAYETAVLDALLTFDAAVVLTVAH